MTHRYLRARLPAAVARCEPSGPCAAKDRCLRHRDGLPARGAVLVDGAIAPGADVGCCLLFIAIATDTQPT